MAKPLVASGSLRKRPTWMELYTPIKLVLWRRAILKPQGLIMRKPSHLLQTLRSIRNLMKPKPRTRTMNLAMDDQTAFLKWIFSMKRFTWSNLKVLSIQNIQTDQNVDEPCVYLKASGSNVNFLILYVDDILIMGNGIPMLQDVKSYLGRCFAMKDLECQAKHIRYLSSAKPEYIAAFDASKEAVWLNESGITKEKVQHRRKLTDPLTKALAFPKHFRTTRNIVHASSK
ncbi:putative retrotransposon protein [Tanacetum coccineum]|uniref:Retrotransposon protein n=1 Tax=Tanacetum coccineum TaxID=301880 RepID=A0ABQ5CI33_9ASTR